MSSCFYQNYTTTTHMDTRAYCIDEQILSLGFDKPRKSVLNSVQAGKPKVFGYLSKSCMQSGTRKFMVVISENSNDKIVCLLELG